jgi:diaminopimelate epimerase
MNALSFMKLETAGNDSLLVDLESQKGAKERDYSELAPAMLARHHGAGARFLITLEKTEKGLNLARAFRADGLEIPARGDLLISAGRYLFDSGRGEAEGFSVLTMDGEQKIEVISARDFRVALGVPKDSLSGEALSDERAGKGLTVLSGGERRIALSLMRLGGPWAALISDSFKKKGHENLDALRAGDPRTARARLVEVRPVSRDSVFFKSKRGLGYNGAFAAGVSVVAAAQAGASEREAITREGGGLRYVDWDRKTGAVYVTAEALYVYEGTWYLPDGASAESAENAENSKE